MKKIFSILMIVMMVCCFIPTAAFAVDGEATTDGGQQTSAVNLDVSKSKTATNLDENFESQVTLSLPSASYKPSVDVVMVIDVSSSMKDADISEAKAAATAMCDELASYTNVETKVGIVTFDQTAHNLTSGLVSIADAKTAIDSIAASADTNMMAGLIAGKAMLDIGSGTDKYLVLMSDGIPIYWVDEDGNPKCKMLEFYAKDKTTLLETRVLGTEPEASDNDFSTMKTMDEIMAIDDWDTDNDTRMVVGDTGEQLENGYKYSNIQKSTYMTAKYLQDNILGKYNLKMVAFGTDKYENNVVYKYGENLCDWIGAQPGVSYFKVSKPGYGGETGDLVKAFTDITNEVVQVVDAGSYVIDEMGKTDEYDFDFINDLSKLELTVGGTALEKEKIEDNVYGFGPQTDENERKSYRYMLTYYPETEQTETAAAGAESFRWDINEAITIDNTVQLTYSVKLTNPKTEPGTYGTYDADGSKGYDGLYTNNSATLYPVDSLNNQGQPQAFPMPTVSYTVEEEPPYIPPTPTYTSVTASKVWILDDGGTAPASVTLQLLRDGQPYRDIKELNADNGWRVTWSGLEYGHTYSVIELDVPDGFISSVREEGIRTFVVVNDDVKAEEPAEPTTPEEPEQPSKPDTPDQPDEPETDVPKTGDDQNIAFWMLLMAATLAALGVTLKLGRKER